MWIRILSIILFVPSLVSAWDVPSNRKIDWSDAGATITDRTTIYTTIETADQGDDTSAINTALTNCPSGQVVKLGTGTFTITGELNIPSNVTLRGDGPANTILARSSTGRGTVGMEKTGNGWAPNQISGTSFYLLTGTMALEDTTVTVGTGNGSNFSTDDYVWIGQKDGSNPDAQNYNLGMMIYDGDNHAIGMMTKVVSVDGDTITLDTGLIYPFSTTYDARIAIISSANVTENAGVEDLKIDNSGAPVSSNMNYQIGMMYAYNCWADNIEIDTGEGRHFRFEESYKCTFKNSYIHHSKVYASGGSGYSIGVMGYSTKCLITNNIVLYNNAGLFFEAAGGNVVSYNYMQNSWLDESGGDFQMANIGTHQATPVYNLVEGNWVTRLQQDAVHGNAVYQTFLRNVATADDDWGNFPEHTNDDLYQRGAFQFERNNNYTNAVGNILGYTDADFTADVYEVIGIPSNSTEWVYRIGDTDVRSTALRHGNVDGFNDTVRWCNQETEGCQGTTGSDHDLPDSYYLSAKPSWWDDQGDCRPWPPIGPDVSGYIVDIPAKDRFEGETYDGECGSPGITLHNTGLIN